MKPRHRAWGASGPALAVAAIIAAGAAGTAATEGAAAQSVPIGTPIPQKALGEEIDDGSQPRAFLAHQLTFDRVEQARDSSDEVLRALFAEKEIAYPAAEIFLRVLKHERIMELWARDQDDSTFTLLREYPVCALPGQLGPKRQMGDFQVPEGFYYIDGFNPRSNYHLALRVSYPNLSDHIRREAVSLGGDIFVHGGCETVGCVPIEDGNIREVYWLATQAIAAGQRVIPIHIFPSRMDPRTVRWLENTFEPEPDLRDFWRNLAEGYAFFENTRRVPWVTVSDDGRYAVPATPRLAARPSAVDSPADDTGASESRAPDSIRGSRSAGSMTVNSLRVDSLVVDSIGIRPVRVRSGKATDESGAGGGAGGGGSG